MHHKFTRVRWVARARYIAISSQKDAILRSTSLSPNTRCKMKICIAKSKRMFRRRFIVLISQFEKKIATATGLIFTAFFPAKNKREITIFR